jgi:ATP-dependent DNA helicase RecG
VNLETLRADIACGEDSTRQFKVDVSNGDSLASELVAFANAAGGTIYIGVADDGSIPGLSAADVRRVNQILGNTSSQAVRSPLTLHTENVPLGNGRLVVVVRVPMGIDRPYFDRNGVIWLKSGADKRRVNSKEELRRLFQMSEQFHADELPTRAGLEALDRLRFRDFLREVYRVDWPETRDEQSRLLLNMNLATDDGRLNLAAVLMFAENPEWIVPSFVVKAIRFPGTTIHETTYLETEDFSGPLQKVFDSAMGFVMRNLHKIQAGRGVNAPGTPEIPEVVFEELLVNALVHRDYLVSAPIRLFVFDDRIEIISPGHLPNNLTVEKIRTGNSNIRNPILVSYVAKGLLPYHGLGSGITRSLAAWPHITFVNDHEGCLFTATVHRIPLESSEKTTLGASHGAHSSVMSSEKGSEKVRRNRPSGGIEGVKGSEKVAERVLAILSEQPALSVSDVAHKLGLSPRAIEKHVARLREAGRLRRVGPPRGGRWEVPRS